ncbi:DUF4825 domain-containing protein [uncultured Oscillibacter sp.]|uniref:DUF4825 domain-containing protein n=1 Tax=uncultured Oscillibacter sp. TaxID=876091 RepID=UPI00272A20E8|nr:DUF4825 domain-containing protein [uncultured Oscillibacter sp.]
MKNDLTCGVVRDLLPSYVENLLGEESKEAVDRHLETCPECRERKEDMAAPTGAEETAEAAKEVDFLRRVKKGTVKKIALAVVCTVLLVVGGYLLKEFVIGRTPDAEHISIENPQVDAENNLNLLADTYWGAYELRGLKSTEENGILTYTAREVRVNPFQTAQGGYRKQIPLLSIPLKGLDEVWICGRLVWQDGMVIDRDTLLLLDAKTPYCGDAPALGNIAKLLQVGSRIGRYNISLQTSERPYRWTLEFEETEETTSEISGLSRFLGYQMLALVENLDEVCFQYPSSSGFFTAEIASNSLARLTEVYNDKHATSWPVHESIKEYAESPLEYQRMVKLLEEMFLGTSGTTVTVVKP